MNVYDFDKTIYNGDSSVDFYFFCLKRHPKILVVLPTQLKGFAQYGLHKIDKTTLKENYFSFLSLLKDVNSDVEKFWCAKKHKLMPWYLNQKQPSDVVISASPRFLLEPILKSIGITRLIATDVDPKTGKFNSKNCHGQMKLVYFRTQFPVQTIDNFYSDSASDAPMAKAATKAYLVNKNKLSEWSI